MKMPSRTNKPRLPTADGCPKPSEERRRPWDPRFWPNSDKPIIPPRPGEYLDLPLYVTRVTSEPPTILNRLRAAVSLVRHWLTAVLPRCTRNARAIFPARPRRR